MLCDLPSAPAAMRSSLKTRTCYAKDWSRRFIAGGLSIERSHRSSLLISVLMSTIRYLSELSVWQRRIASFPGFQGPSLGEMQLLLSWVNQARPELLAIWPIPRRLIVGNILRQGRLSAASVELLDDSGG